MYQKKRLIDHKSSFTGIFQKYFVWREQKEYFRLLDVLSLVNFIYSKGKYIAFIALVYFKE